jgi:hypothetical protein
VQEENKYRKSPEDLSFNIETLNSIPGKDWAELQ